MGTASSLSLAWTADGNSASNARNLAIAIIFGLCGWFAPEASLAILMFIFAAYFFVDGAIRTWLAIASKNENPLWWMLLVGGLISIAAAFVTLFAPNVTAILMLYFIAAWAIAIGVIEIVIASKLRKEITNEWLLIGSGIISIIFGGYLIFNPGAGIITLLWLVATYAVVFGIMMVLLALKLKKLNEQA